MKDDEIKATLLAHHSMLFALAKSHPDPAKVLSQFGPAISDAIQNEPSPAVQGILASLEQGFRALLK